MKKSIVVGCVGMIGALCLAAGIRGAEIPTARENTGPTAVAPGKLIVHEWGTFTGFAGADGVNLPFNTIFGLDLPGFVENRLTHSMRQNPKLNIMLFVKGGGAPALQRMETPVIYFYADAPTDVDVRVDFPKGLLSEFYPPVRNLGPAYGASYGEYVPPESTAPAKSGAAPKTQPVVNDLGTPSFLDWGRVRIVPHPTGDEAKLIPAITGANHYAFARDTDSALVQFTQAGGAKHEEKFLFYRGLGNFTMPVTLIPRGGDRFELKNISLSPIPSAFLVHVDKDGRNTTRFARFENIAGNQVLALPKATSTPGNLGEEITQSLIADGLYEKEARAMVATWKSNWLEEPGTRLLYILPRPVADAMLPLRIQPAPQEMARVFVGRIDALTPEQETRLRSMMLSVDTGGTLSDDDARTLDGLGRFARPALERISKLAGAANPEQEARLQQALWHAWSNHK